MLKLFALPMAAGVAALSGAAAFASDVSRSAPSHGKWRFSIDLAAVNADVRLVDSEVVFTDASDFEDAEVTLSDEMSVSSTALAGAVGYRVVPFLELSARAGLASTTSETGASFTTQVEDLFGVYTGPISFDAVTENEVQGYTLGLGANAIAPLASVGGRTLAVRGGFNYAWNRFEDDEVVTSASKTSLGLVYPIDRDGPQGAVYTVSGSHNWLTRDVERTTNLGGQDVTVVLAQEFEDPWSIDAGAAFPLSDAVGLGFGASYAFSGATSVVAAITFTPR